MQDERAIEVLDERLTEAATRLEGLTDLIRSIDLNPDENVRRIGEAIGQISLIRKDIYARRPDLLPENLRLPGH